MVDVPRIGIEEARRKVAAGEALLVCAYEDETKCQRNHLEGSIGLRELQARLPDGGRGLNDDEGVMTIVDKGRLPWPR